MKLFHILIFLAYINSSICKLPSDCFTAYPNQKPCYQYTEDSQYRLITGNSIPSFPVAPYCPFGVGKGYCIPGEDPCPFKGWICPAQKNAPKTGDVLVPQEMNWKIPINPNPTDSSKPSAMYHDNSKDKFFRLVENYILGLAPPMFPPDAIGVGVGPLEGVTLFGPTEAGGTDVDIARMNLSSVCGGHVTPPVGGGPLFHFHKDANCLKDKISIPGEHGPLIGYAMDGFGIYGYDDELGKTPVLDECNGHFGPVPDRPGEVIYHYHANRNVTNVDGKTYVPYMLGCQGPAKGLCKTKTIDPRHKKVFCGPGCGYQICVQPGTSKSALETYINKFGNSTWLSGYTVNPY